MNEYDFNRLILGMPARKPDRKYKLYFLLGVLVGVMIMLLMVGGHRVYNRHFRWGGLDPSSKVMEIYSILNRHSIMPFSLDEMVDSMYRGLLDGVRDANTRYLSRVNFAAFHERMGGTFVGIGVQIIICPADSKITVDTVFRDSPAEYAGIMRGDKFIAVDGRDVTGMSLQEVVRLITGQENTYVTISVYRESTGERFDVEIVRARVEMPSVSLEIYDFLGLQIAYLRIATFDQVTFGQFNHALDELIEEGAQALIIDVRNNSGGLLGTVNRITDRLIPEGVITFTEDALGQRVYHYSGEEYLGLPLVVLVNRQSASASEILSGAVRDSGVGTVVGEQTFGKGTVQQTFRISDGSAVQVTVQKYFTPSGESIENIGITPHITVELEEEYRLRIGGDLAPEDDVQLQAALQAAADKIGHYAAQILYRGEYNGE